MSSFQKKKFSSTVPGTKVSLQNGQPLASTGNSYLDALLGGGLAIGSLLLIEEDKFATYSNSLSKFFLTDGIVNNQSIFVVNLDDDPEEFIQKLPQVCKTDTEEKLPENIPNKSETSDMRIAWRYNSLPSMDTTQKSLTYFDSSKRIDREMLASSDIEYFKPIDERLDSPTEQSFHNSVYGQILVNLKTKLNNSKFSAEESDGAGKNLLRISISSLGSPLWYDDDFLEDVCLFLYCLKALVRTSLAVACISVPSHLFKHLDDSLIHRIRNMVDYSVELESFAGSDKETNPIFKDYHGLLYIRKLAAVNSLAAYNPVTRDLVFKLKRKSFVIEKLHLPPDLQEIDTKPDAIPSMSCGSSSKKLLDF
ncbi:elongator complex protein 4 [Bradysia coprophila]|uniref:elongator complex protein 4 n=1 Tax=Bradysia coprophila TaxID=38358 RepID=UPI00187D9C05|nr:elongator complex protein 4 [Bradysia coprophila]